MMYVFLFSEQIPLSALPDPVTAHVYPLFQKLNAYISEWLDGGIFITEEAALKVSLPNSRYSKKPANKNQRI